MISKLQDFLQESNTVKLVLAAGLIYFLFFTGDTAHDPDAIEIAPGAYSRQIYSQLADQTQDVADQLSAIDFERQSLEQVIKTRLLDGEFKTSTTLLLEEAARAIAQGDKKKLGNIMLLLGRVATNAQELDTAEVYLQEALDIALESGDSLAAARAYQQFGHLHIRSRELARDAGTAYDNLWLARNQIYLGRFNEARANLEQVIEANMAIRRYGAAASAYETLSGFHRRFHDDFLAQDAAMEAARLYASSGQIDRSQRILASLQKEGLDNLQAESMQAEIDSMFRQHIEDVTQVAIARDYEMLYRHYNATGDYDRAWKLRILASKSLAKTSSRSMFQRQPDVLAILYNSNFTMDKARASLDQASNLFSGQGEDDLTASTRDMYSLIY